MEIWKKSIIIYAIEESGKKCLEEPMGLKGNDAHLSL